MQPTKPMMKTRLSKLPMETPALAATALLLCGALAVSAQTITDPCPNRVISWNLDHNGTIASVDLAGVAPAINWNNSWPSNPLLALPDNTATPTTLDLGYGSFNTWSVGGHPGLDANGTANKELVNGYLNSGPAGWGPSTTNTYVSLTNVPYALYDVVVYFNADASGRKSTIEGPNATYSFTTMGSAARSGANALFIPTTQTNEAVYPTADFAVWRGLTSANAKFTTFPKSGNDQWLGICGFQVIESSNAYVLHGPYPATQIAPVGQPASFSIIASGQDVKYQWRHAGTPITDATNAAYSIAATVLGEEGDYDVIITNSFSAITSAVATLTLYSPKSLEWAGNNSTWDTTTAAWTTNGGGSTLAYTDSDNVLFSPLGSAQPTVTLSSTRTPGLITVSNGSYTLVGGSLSGSGALHLKNNATLILDTPDTRSGPTTIDAGSTLQLDNNDTAGSLGSGALTNNGTLLFYAAGDEAYGYPVAGTGNVTNISTTGTITLGNNITGSSLVQAGAGILLLQGSNSLAGGFVVNSGTVWARAADCLGGGAITVNGGTLELYFGFDFGGSSMLLAGGQLSGGLNGSSTFGGSVTLATSSTILVGAGNTFTLTNAAGLNGGASALTKTGNGTLILPGAGNTWSGLTISAGTLQIGNGGSGASLGSGAIADEGTLAFNTTSDVVVTNDISGGGGVTQSGSGTVTLASAANTYFGQTTVNNGRLLVNGVTGAGDAVVNGGSLGGTGSLGGSVSVLPAGTLSPGASVGTLNVSGNLTLGGNVLIEVNKSLAPSLTNDYVVVTGALSNTNNGVVTVNNLGPAFVAGDMFKLFSQPVTGGETLSITSPGVTWTNKLALDGTISVLSVGPAIPSYPTNLSFSASGGTLALSWPLTHLGWILQSQTNSRSIGISTNWTDVAGSGGMTSTNLPVSTTSPTVFFRLRYP
jgi:autotransporter-associated beta strand protein